MFKKGQPGRKIGYVKPVFDVRIIINNRFPGRKIDLERKALDIAHKKNSRGRDLMILYVSGKPLSPKQAIIAQCAECMSYYDDKKEDCECPLCPLYQYMPYKQKEDKAPCVN